MRVDHDQGTTVVYNRSPIGRAGAGNLNRGNTRHDDQYIVQRFEHYDVSVIACVNDLAQHSLMNNAERETNDRILTTICIVVPDVLRSSL